MNDLEKLYIEVELGVTPFSELGNTASEHLFGKGIECEDYELYSVIYDNYHEFEDDKEQEKKLKQLLDDKESSLLILPLDCRYDCSYDGWLEYKAENDREYEIQRFFESRSVYKHRSNMKYEIQYKGENLVSDCPRKLKGLLRNSWIS